MDLSLNALVEDIDDSLFEQASRDFRAATGVSPGEAPVAPLAVLTRNRDVFQFISELLESPRTDEGKRGRLSLLRRYVAQVWVESQAKEQTGALERALGTQTFHSGARTWSLAEAIREVPRLAAREARVAVEQALSSELQGIDDLFARRWDAVLQAASALAGGLQPLVELVQGKPVAARLESARALLRLTEDPYLDLLDFTLKRVDPSLTRRTAGRHDVERAALGPWLFEAFSREDLEHAVARTMSDLGLNPAADGRITIDIEARPGRVAGSHLFELRVPDQLRLVLSLDAGLDTYASWLHTWGRAMHRAHVGKTLPFVERRLGDASVISGFATSFESLLLEEGWLKRYLRLTALQAKEAARVFAFRQVLELRKEAALALVQAEVGARGSARELVDDYVPHLSQALGVEVPRGRYRSEVELFGGALGRLDAFALESVLHEHLRERFNEDFYRNPAAGRALVGLASRGQREDAAQLAASLDTGAPDVLVAARRRIALMGA